MLDRHPDVRSALVSDRLADLAASYEPGTPVRLRLALRLAALAERLARPYAPARVTYARVR